MSTLQRPTRGSKVLLRYTSAYGTPDRIEIDLNFLHRVPLLPVQEHALWQPREIERPKTLVVSLEELCTGKLCALLDRCQPRDLFDASHLPAIAGHVLEAPRFRALFIAMAGTLDHPLYRYGLERLKRVTDEMVFSELHPMLSADHRPSAGNLQASAWKVIRPLLELTPEERQYSEKIQSGELD